jgi:hypothetical protein
MKVEKTARELFKRVLEDPMEGVTIRQRVDSIISTKFIYFPRKLSNREEVIFDNTINKCYEEYMNSKEK